MCAIANTGSACRARTAPRSAGTSRLPLPAFGDPLRQLPAFRCPIPFGYLFMADLATRFFSVEQSSLSGACIRHNISLPLQNSDFQPEAEAAQLFSSSSTPHRPCSSFQMLDSATTFAGPRHRGVAGPSRIRRNSAPISCLVTSGRPFRPPLSRQQQSRLKVGPGEPYTSDDGDADRESGGEANIHLGQWLGWSFSATRHFPPYASYR